MVTPTHAPRGPGAGRRVVLVLLLLIALALVLALAQSQLLRPIPSAIADPRALQLAALRRYAARADSGALLPPGHAVLAFREAFLQSAIEQSLPLRQYFANGRYVARLDHAVVRFDTGLAWVTLAGRGMLTDQEDAPLYADLVLHGLVTVSSVDPDSGTLRASVVVTDVVAAPSRPQELRALLSPVVHYFGRLQAWDWNRARQQIHLPIRIERDLVLPAVEGDVAIPATVVPIRLRLAAVTTYQGRLAISLALLPDRALGEAADPPGARPHHPRPSLPRQVWTRLTPRWLAGLLERSETRRLVRAVATLARGDPLWQSVVTSDHDVVIVIPTPVLRTLANRASRRYLRGVDVDVRPRSVIPLHSELKVRLLGKPRGVGHLEGGVRVEHLAGRLTVRGAPRVALEPPDLVIDVPARLEHGHGAVAIDGTWKPGLLAGLVCHGFAFQDTLAGELLPYAHRVVTRIRWTIRDSTIVGTPRLEQDTLRFPVDLTDASWDRVRDVLASQDKLMRCGLVMNADSALGKLRQLAHRGIRVRLPAAGFHPFRMPAILEERYTAGDYRIEARAFAPEVRLEPAYLRLAFQARLRLAADTTRTRPRPRPAAPPPSGGGPAPTSRRPVVTRSRRAGHRPRRARGSG